ncbi:MAG: hypothetical protein LBI18_08270 [Planctomycetaceae bacterium]|jgi:hypothetical protein|nr:hypothetical protein [Planctomycetaceae bacterium]
METTIIQTIITQCPVLIAFIWFLITITNQHHKTEATLAKQFQDALDKVVEKIGERLDRIENELIRIQKS